MTHYQKLTLWCAGLTALTSGSAWEVLASSYENSIIETAFATVVIVSGFVFLIISTVAVVFPGTNRFIIAVTTLAFAFTATVFAITSLSATPVNTPRYQEEAVVYGLIAILAGCLLFLAIWLSKKCLGIHPLWAIIPITLPALSLVLFINTEASTEAFLVPALGSLVLFTFLFFFVQPRHWQIKKGGEETQVMPA